MAGQSSAMGINEGSPLPESLDFVLEVAEGVGGFITVGVVGAPVHGLVFVALVGGGLVWGGFVGCRGGFVRCWGGFVSY